MSSALRFDEYRALVEAAPVMIWRAGIDGKCDYFNETWLTFTGRTSEQEVGDGWMEGVHPDDVDRVRRTFRDHFDKRQPFEIEYRLRRHDGVYRWIFDRGGPFEIEDRFAGFIGSCIDVQERHDAAAHRRTTLSMVAHELRTPLSAMQTYVEVIQAKAAVAAPVFEKLARQVQRLAKLIDDLSDTARVEGARDLPLKKARIDLAEVVRRVGATYEELAPRRTPRIQFETRIEPGHYTVHADPDRMEQIVVNVIENACKFSHEDGRVVLALFTEAERVCVRVTDEGVGIPPHELPDVTLPYFRGSNAPAARVSGAGMGLAIAKQLVAQHGGQLQIASEPGRGTEVTVCLPRAS
jgi:PAS domain S-box-containing protein